MATQLNGHNVNGKAQGAKAIAKKYSQGDKGRQPKPSTQDVLARYAYMYE